MCESVSQSVRDFIGYRAAALQPKMILESRDREKKSIHHVQFPIRSIWMNSEDLKMSPRNEEKNQMILELNLLHKKLWLFTL